MPPEKYIVGAALVAILIFALALHEAAHAAVANWCGDDTAKRLGRVTLNPIKSIDPVLTILLPGLLFFVLPALLGTPPLMFGGAKPVPVNVGRLRSPYRDMMWVALAGPATNLILALLSMALLKGLLVGRRRARRHRREGPDRFGAVQHPADRVQHDPDPAAGRVEGPHVPPAGPPGDRSTRSRRSGSRWCSPCFFVPGGQEAHPLDGRSYDWFVKWSR